MASVEDIKATGYIFIISNHTIFTTLCLWGKSWKWKYLHPSGALLIVYQKNCLRSWDEKIKQRKKAGNKKRKQIVSLPSLPLSRWSVISSHLAHFDGEGAAAAVVDWGVGVGVYGCGCGGVVVVVGLSDVFLFNISVLSPPCLGLRSAAVRRRGVAGV